MSEVLLQQILSELKDVKTGQQQAKKRFDTIDMRLESMDARFDSMQGQIDSMQTQVTNLKNQTDRIEARQETILEQTAFLSEFKEKTVVRLENTATKDDLQYIEAKLMEHDRELFNLKKRA